MAIIELSAEQVLKSTREALGLKSTASCSIDGALLAGLLRRTAGILCPCSPATLRATVLESLQFLANDVLSLSESIVDAIEGLIIVGDLLELSQITIDDPSVKGTWLFAAPPGFIVRSSGSVMIVGLTQDESAPLPESLKSRITHEGLSRLIKPLASEDLPSALRDLGLLELSERTWLKGPHYTSALDLSEDMLRRLREEPPSGHIDRLAILKRGCDVHYYAGRWASLQDQTGSFVARRPQAYGAPIWGYAMVENGRVTRFLDFPLKGASWRGCDIAWHLQMAIDYLSGTPQVYRRRLAPDGGFLDFYSPLPVWVQRRLSAIGRRTPGESCLFSFWLPESELEAEEEYLQKSLWLIRSEASE